MVAANPAISAYDVGSKFAALLRDDETIKGAVKKLWVRGNQDCVDIWLLTEPITYNQRIHIRSLKRRLYEQFPQTNLAVELHIEHAGLYDVEPGQFHFDAPRGAQTVKVR